MHKLNMYPIQDFLKKIIFYLTGKGGGGASSQMDYCPLVFQLYFWVTSDLAQLGVG